MITVINDSKYAFRQLRKNPGYALIVILILGLGIGGTTLMFSVVNTVLLKPLPYADEDRLAMIWETCPEEGEFNCSVSWPNFRDWKEHSQAFESMALVANNSGSFEKNSGGGREQGALKVNGAVCSANLFSLLGVRPILGRCFLPEEDAVESQRVVIVDYGFWKENLDGDPVIIGERILLDREEYQVVGVLGAEFKPFHDDYKEAKYWTNLAKYSFLFNQRGNHCFSALGKMKPGVSLLQANLEMDAIEKGLAQEKSENKGKGIQVVSLRGEMVKDVCTALWVLLGAVGFTLLVVCSNVANLILAKASGRGKEMAVRSALGASAGRLVGQAFVESLLLAILGGALGLLLVYDCVDLLRGVMGQSIPRLSDLTVDGRVLGFTVGVSLLTGLLSGAAPAWRMSRQNLMMVINQTAGRSMSARSRFTQDVLVIAQIALSLVLLIGAGLLIRSFIGLMMTDPGMKVDNILTFEVSLPGNDYNENAKRIAAWTQIQRKVAETPGVLQVGATSCLPFKDNQTVGFEMLDSTSDIPEHLRSARFQVVTPGYFQALGIPLLTGRFFDQQDLSVNVGKVIINQAMAKRFWPTEDPIGKHINPSCRYGGESPNSYEIIGVAANANQEGLDQETKPEYALLYTQMTSWNMSFVVKTVLPPTQLIRDLRTQIASIDPHLPIYNILPMAQRISKTLTQRRFTVSLFTGFSMMTLLLAVLGLYGVMAYNVGQRTQEIGIRMALGAQQAEVVRMVLHQGMRLTGIGIGAGLIGSFVLGRVVRSMLFGITPTDTITYGIVSGLLIAASLLACYLPARRAACIDPMIALRCE